MLRTWHVCNCWQHAPSFSWSILVPPARGNSLPGGLQQVLLLQQETIVGMTPNVAINTLAVNLAVPPPIFSTILSFLYSLSPFWYCLWSLSRSTSAAWCHVKSLLPSIASSMVLGCLLVWRTSWLWAGLCSTVCCHTGLHKQSSCYWCSPFPSSGSLHAGSSTAGPTMVS